MDINDAAIEALNQERTLLRALMDTIPDHIYFKDTESQFLRINKAMSAWFGLSDPDQAIGKTDFDFFTEDHARPAYLDEQEVMRTGQPLKGKEEKETWPDGRETWVSTTKVPLRNGDGRIIGTFGLSRDITEHKCAEQERENLLALIEHSFDFIAMASPEGNVSYLNSAGQQLVGLANMEAAKTTRIFEYVPPEEREKLRRATVAVIGDGFWHGETYIKHFTTGEHIPVEVNSFLIKRQETGRPIVLAVVAHNLTRRRQADEERRRLEAQLRQAQKMEAIGTLAGGIAHDFNNILGTILGYTELLLNNHPAHSRERSYLEEVYRAGERATDLVRQILTFSRTQEHVPKPVYLPPLIKEALKMLRATLPSTIEIQQSLDPGCRPMLGDATQIHQVIMNLCTNAFQAMKDTGGVLEVSLEEMAKLPPHVDLPQSPYLKLMVKDTGCGMTADVKERIFEPFFTTKEVGEGTGLGLAVVHGIVKTHQGVILVESQPRKGTTFSLFFPVIEEIVQGEAPEAETFERGTEHILIVEDEIALAEYYAIILKELGYQVTVAHNGHEAVEIFRAQPDQYDLIFTDQTMPKMTGIQMSQTLRDIRPDLPIILATGYSDTILGKDPASFGIHRFLTKPVKMTTLTRMIREIKKGGENATNSFD